MSRITLKHLRYFDAVARHRHFGRAAEACAISQPAISLQMKELEGIFGAQLVERRARDIHLTLFGEKIHDRVRAILIAADELEEISRQGDGPFSGTLRLGVIPTIAPYYLPKIIRILSDSFPKLTLEFRESLTRALITELLDGRIDMAVVALPISEPALDELPLFEEAFVLVSPAQTAEPPPRNPEALAKERLLLLEEGHCFRDQALSFCGLTAGPTTSLMEGSSLTTLVQMVELELGLTLIPEMAVASEIRSPRLIALTFDENRPFRQVGIVCRKTTPQLDSIGEIARILRAAGPPHQSPAGA